MKQTLSIAGQIFCVSVIFYIADKTIFDLGSWGIFCACLGLLFFEWM